MQKHLCRVARATLLTFAVIAPGLAEAQSAFFVRIVGAPATIACAPESVAASGGTFALAWNVPGPELDAALDGQINGVTVISGPVTIPGSSGTVPGDLAVSFPATSFPYTFRVILTPSVPGIPPTGISFFCPAAGPGSNFRILGEAPPVPALSSIGIACIGVLLVIAGFAELRRRGTRMA